MPNLSRSEVFVSAPVTRPIVVIEVSDFDTWHFYLSTTSRSDSDYSNSQNSLGVKYKKCHCYIPPPYLGEQ